MSDLDAIRGREQKIDAMIDEVFRFYGVSAKRRMAIRVALNERAGELAALLAALATAEAEREGLKRELALWRETYTDEAAQVWTRPTAWSYAKTCAALEAAKARADAAERRGERMGRAMTECALLLEVLRAQDAAKPYAEISRDFMADVVKATDSARAALARAEGENATRTDDPRPEGSGGEG